MRAAPSMSWLLRAAVKRRTQEDEAAAPTRESRLSSCFRCSAALRKDLRLGICSECLKAYRGDRPDVMLCQGGCGRQVALATRTCLRCYRRGRRAMVGIL